MPVKLKKSPLSLRETAKRLGVSRSRTKDILKIVDSEPRKKKRANSSNRAAQPPAARNEQHSYM
jgi:hypothetical protein